MLILLDPGVASRAIGLCGYGFIRVRGVFLVTFNDIENLQRGESNCPLP